MDLGLGGKTVLITGGSRGIGYATARVFASEGTDLHLVSRTREDLERARNAIRSEFPVAVDIHVADLSSGEQILAVAHACADADILVNNAGAIPLGTLLDVDDETWRAAWDLKLFGYITMMRAMYAEMKARGRGVIVNNIGTAGDQKPSGYAAGVTANGALVTLTRALGGTSLDDGIRVLGISPGDMENDRGIMALRHHALNKFGDSDRWRELMSGMPGGSLPVSGDMADAIVFLASPRARFISGVVLTIDGGMCARQAVIGG
ncbi:MAG: SDR family oxidoreductase [Alphaproteobacteria bacterium]|nr:SDR family oxidoreductase [Alphaproteobacteria bacterium]